MPFAVQLSEDAARPANPPSSVGFDSLTNPPFWTRLIDKLLHEDRPEIAE